MFTAVKDYFSEFKVLKTASKDFWLINGMVFFDALAYFSMMNVITLYLTDNVGFSDLDSGVWVGIFTLYITAFVLGVGSICDTIGIKKSFLIGLSFLILARLTFGFAPIFLKGEMLQYAIMVMIFALAFGTAFMSPVLTASLRRFTTKENRGTGFNVYYLIMNVGAILAGFAVTDGLRKLFGEIGGNLAIMDFGLVMNILAAICVLMVKEDNYADEEDRVVIKDEDRKRPLAIFMEVWKESAFQKLVVFLLLTIGVRLVFTHQFLVMPKYYTRVLQSDFELGLANSINPFIIVFGLILLIPIASKFDTFKIILAGMTISAFSLLVMCLPIQWTMMIPGIHNLDQAYRFIIFAQILLFAFGELLFSPRFTQYTSMMAPKDKVASYMSLAVLPMFIAKPINGFVSGALVSSYSYDGIRAKIESGNISYMNSPEFMWFVYFTLALLSPLAIIIMRNFLRTDAPAPTAESAA
jgi:MFS family permease